MSPRAAPSGITTASVDLALLTLRGRQLSVLVARAASGPRAELPWRATASGTALDAQARQLGREIAGIAPSWLEQAVSIGDGAHPSKAALSVGYVGVVVDRDIAAPWRWASAGSTAGLADRHRRIVGAAVRRLRAQVEVAPVAFHMLPPSFSLSELQSTYEAVLGRRLHKASFRRALHAAWVVEPLDEWRSEGPGRPAQLFRYAGRHPRATRRGVRFDFM